MFYGYSHQALRIIYVETNERRKERVVDAQTSVCAPQGFSRVVHVISRRLRAIVLASLFCLGPSLMPFRVAMEELLSDHNAAPGGHFPRLMEPITTALSSLLELPRTKQSSC